MERCQAQFSSRETGNTVADIQQLLHTLKELRPFLEQTAEVVQSQVHTGTEWKSILSVLGICIGYFQSCDLLPLVTDLLSHSRVCETLHWLCTCMYTMR